ncbi:MAG: hypothetical protein AB1626_00485 [Candidatus Micrarchaeota archaeon]
MKIVSLVAVLVALAAVSFGCVQSGVSSPSPPATVLATPLAPTLSPTPVATPTPLPAPLPQAPENQSVVNETGVNETVSNETIEEQMPRGTKDANLAVDAYVSDKVFTGTTLFAEFHDAQKPRIVEVNMLGEVVWQLAVKNAPSTRSPGWLYKAERIPA